MDSMDKYGRYCAAKYAYDTAVKFAPYKDGDLWRDVWESICEEELLSYEEFCKKHIKREKGDR